MTLLIFSIHDVKAELFGPPFFMSTPAEALRAFVDLADDPNTTIGKHPGDYRLVRLGTYDNISGIFENREHQNLGFASDYQRLGKVTPLSVKEASK